MQKIRELLDTTKKETIAGIIVIALIIISGVTISSLHSNKSQKLSIGKENIIIEYGEQVPTDITKYINTDSLSSTEEKDIIKHTKIEGLPKNEKKKRYPAVGDYELTLTYKDEELATRVVVKDTTPPTLQPIKEIQLRQGTNLDSYDFKKVVKVEDLSEIKEPVFKMYNVDTVKTGEYKMTIEVEDIYNNKTEQEVKVVVVQTALGDKVTREEVITNADGEVSVVIHVEDRTDIQTGDRNENNASTPNTNE